MSNPLMLHPFALIFAACLLLSPLLLAGFAPRWTQSLFAKMHTVPLCLLSASLAVPFATVAISYNHLTSGWLLLYLWLPPAVIGVLAYARRTDPEQRGTPYDFGVLLLLGLAVDLRWFEPAWPTHLAVYNKMLLLDLGILGFLGARQLGGVGFDLRLRLRDLGTGLREFAVYAPAAIVVGLYLGFLHVHRGWPRPGTTVFAALFTFFFIAIPEELFFRGWLQNLLERRLGRTNALAFTSVLFGLSHFNKRAAHFNWRYVLLATLAGVFYGRAWRRNRRIAASALTHTLVDTVWSLTLR